MKIDLHVHTSEYSRCAISTEKEQIEAAIAKGLDGIAITDHANQRSPERLRQLNEKYAPFKIFTGVEVNPIDTFEDVLVIGVPDMHKMNTYNWHYPQLHEFVRERGGFIALPHPFRWDTEVRTPVHKYLPDAIEAKSVNIVKENTPQILTFAKTLGVPTIVTSDSHQKKHVGANYIVLHNHVQTDAELVRELQGGRYD